MWVTLASVAAINMSGRVRLLVHATDAKNRKKRVPYDSFSVFLCVPAVVEAGSVALGHLGTPHGSHA
jgi:hypothetical protein